MRRGLAISMGIVAVVVGVMPSCREPTQLEVEIRTLAPLRCNELRGISIVVAKDPFEAEEKLKSGFISARAACGPNDDTVGTLVITPSESKGALIVAAGYGPGVECRAPGFEDCILARRRFSFVDHVSLKLKVVLEAACVGRACDALTSCKNAVCRSSEVACDEDGRCEVDGDGSPTADGGSPTQPDGAPATLPDGAPRPETRSDGGNDAGGDGGLSGITNLCPLPSGPAECPQTCCGMGMEFGCTDPIFCNQAQLKKLNCTGKKGCPKPGDVCCFDTGNQLAICSPCTSGVPLCSTNDDCPSGRTCKLESAVTAGPYAVRGCGI